MIYVIQCCTDADSRHDMTQYANPSANSKDFSQNKSIVSDTYVRNDTPPLLKGL